MREASGLALSSRNGYLSERSASRRRRLHQELQGIAAAVRTGHRDYPALESSALQALQSAGWVPDYVAIRRRTDSAMPSDGAHLVVVAAATLGSTRLIDNIEV